MKTGPHFPGDAGDLALGRGEGEGANWPELEIPRSLPPGPSQAATARPLHRGPQVLCRVCMCVCVCVCVCVCETGKEGAVPHSRSLKGCQADLE